MGNKESSELHTEEQKLQEHMRSIIECLKTHRENVYGIAHAVEGQYASVQLLSRNLSDIVSETADDDFTEDSEVAGVRTCYHCTGEWQRNTKALLGSIQTSLRCQSNSLVSSFTRVNSCVHKILDFYREDIVSSVEEETKLWIDYEDSPQKNFEQKYSDLKENSNCEIKKLHQAIKTLKENTHRNRQEYKESFKHQNEELTETERKFKQLITKYEVLRKETDTLEEQNAESKRSSQSMGSIITSLNADNKTLRLQLKAMQQTIPVQLYFNFKGDILPKMLDELKTMLVTQIKVDRHELQFVICQNEKDVNPEIPLFVLCINASRLGTDASSALQSLNVSSKVSVLIFHHKDVHALPNQASERVLTGPEFKTLGGIFDIAFLAERGIYPCDMNHATAVGLEKFLKMQS